MTPPQHEGVSGSGYVVMPPTLSAAPDVPYPIAAMIKPQAHISPIAMAPPTRNSSKYFACAFPLFWARRLLFTKPNSLIV
jgi:hypothetical protein